MMNATHIRKRHSGFSVIELMVSIVIGLLALMFATKLVANSEQSKQASLGGSDALQNGMVALFSITNDASQAGWGLNDPLVNGCNTVFSDTGGFALAGAMRGTTAVTPLAAAVIVPNTTGSDQLSLYSGSAMGATGSLEALTFLAGNQVGVERVVYGFSQGDVILAAPETVGGNCELAQVSAAPGPNDTTLNLAAAGTDLRFNTGALTTVFSGYSTRLFNLGPATGLSFHTWSVQNGFLKLRATDLSGASTGTGSTVIDNVVSLKAQYGFDKRVGAAFTPTLGPQISVWSGSMIDADGDGVVGGAGDYQRVVALRIAVVARSKNPEKPAANGCITTTVEPKVFAASEPFGVVAVPLDVDVGVVGDPVDWKCYRYRVFETIVPLRNTGWRPQ